MVTVDTETVQNADTSNVLVHQHPDGTYTITGLTYVQADWLALALSGQWADYAKDAANLHSGQWPKWSYEYNYPEARTEQARKWLSKYISSIASFSDNLRQKIEAARK